MTQPLIDERRNLNRMAQDELQAIKALIGDVGFSRTQEIRRQMNHITTAISLYKNLIVTDSDTVRSNFNRLLEDTGVPSPEEYNGDPKYIQLLKDKHKEVSGLIEQEFPEHGVQVLEYYANYDRYKSESDAIKINMNSVYGQSV